MKLWNPFSRKSANTSIASTGNTTGLSTKELADRLMVMSAKSVDMSVDRLNELIEKYGNGSVDKLVDPDNGRVNWSVDEIRSLIDEQRYEEALLAANISIRNASNDPVTHSLKINALMFLGRDEEAVKFGNSSLEQWPTSVDLHCVLGCASNKLKLYDRAREHFERALTQDPNHGRSLIGLADGLTLQQRYLEAKLVYDQAVAANPDDGMAWVNRALALFHLREFEAALQSVNRGIELWPSHPTAQMLKSKLMEVMPN